MRSGLIAAQGDRGFANGEIGLHTRSTACGLAVQLTGAHLRRLTLSLGPGRLDPDPTACAGHFGHSRSMLAGHFRLTGPNFLAILKAWQSGYMAAVTIERQLDRTSPNMHEKQ